MRNKRKLTITSFDTIAGDDFNEMFVESFLRTMYINTGKAYSVYYGENENTFRVIYNNIEYYLILDKTIINDYHSLISRLKELIERRETMEKDINFKNNQAIIEQEIIKNAERGIIPDDEAKTIYLNYLKNKKKFSFSKILAYLKNLIKDLKTGYNNTNKFITSVLKKIPLWKHFTNSKAHNVFVDISMSFLIGILSILIYIILMGAIYILMGATITNGEHFNKTREILFYLSTIPFDISIALGITLVVNEIKIRFNRLKTFINDNEILEHKINQLTQELEISSNQINHSSTLSSSEQNQTLILKIKPAYGYTPGTIPKTEEIDNLGNKKPLRRIFTKRPCDKK